MLRRREIYDYFAAMDPRIPPLAEYTEVIRELVTVSVAFEVKDHGWIEYTNYPDTSNMLTRREIYD
jgi:hypothetical protein